MSGKVFLVGAGCGDFDLITVRGAELLGKCDCVIYDALIDPRLLDLAPESAEKICVGKRCGKHSEPQENINRLLVEKAARHGITVRLKGGDPFVFGRGGEEISALKQAEIEYAVVPGISSCIAAPELSGIPVTHRGTARSFHVITGHTGKGLERDDIKKYASLDGTLVFLMGLSRLNEICAALISGGMDKKTPAAVICDGATARQKKAVGRLENIADIAARADISPPAVIVIGQTADFDFSPTVSLPLYGVKVGVTGTKSFVARLSQRLASLGAQVVGCELLNITPLPDACRATEAQNYDRVVLTSANGAELFFENLHAQEFDLRRLSHTKFAVIGSGTKKALTNHGIYPDLTPKIYTAEQLAYSLAAEVKPSERVMIYRAQNGSRALTDILARENVDFTEFKAYRASGKNYDCDFSDCDFITFASASGVNAFFAQGFEIPESAKAVCIGEVTAKTLAAHGADNFRIAKTQNASGITDIILTEAENTK